MNGGPCTKEYNRKVKVELRYGDGRREYKWRWIRESVAKGKQKQARIVSQTQSK